MKYKFNNLKVCSETVEVYPPKTNLHLTAVGGGEQPSRGMPGGAGPSGVKVIDRRTP